MQDVFIAGPCSKMVLSVRPEMPPKGIAVVISSDTTEGSPTKSSARPLGEERIVEGDTFTKATEKRHIIRERENVFVVEDVHRLLQNR